MIHCYICYTENVDPEWICDRCDQHYCEDCSYTFSLHYQHQGNRCYKCADQGRRDKLPSINVLRDRKVYLLLEYISKIKIQKEYEYKFK